MLGLPIWLHRDVRRRRVSASSLRSIRSVWQSIRESAGRTAANLGSLIRNPRIGTRWPLVLTYLRIELKYALLVTLLDREISEDVFLGFRVQFFNYYTFLLLFQDVFLSDSYRFSSDCPEPFIVDCGSNIGMSILYFKRLYPNARIIGFEPDFRTFQTLRHNIEANGLTGVSLFNAALAGSKGTISFYHKPMFPGSPTMSVIKQNLPGVAETHVASDLLSNHISEGVDLLKLDVEGAEDEVVEEMARSQKLRFIRQIIAEYHHHSHPRSARLSGFLKALDHEGFDYQIKAALKTPFSKDVDQDILIYAYRRAPPATSRS
jgi:FkbM family methyltransferase